MNLTFRDNYWDDPELKRQFMAFLKDIHGLDLTLWDNMGYWDNKYRPFSLFKNKTLVSSLCIYSMDMTILGERHLVAQISAMGTIPEFRRQGLGLDLIQRAMKWAGDHHDFFFLFADTDAYPFYNKCGFRLVDEHAVYYPISGITAQPGVKKLSVQRKDHLDLIYRCAAEREPVSDIIGVCNEKLFMFWCLYFLKDNIYYIDELDILVLYRRKNGLLTIFDIVGKKVPPFSEIYPFIGDMNDKTVEFLFMPDKLGLDSYDETKLAEHNGTHLYGDFPLENRKFIIPYTSHA
jgi:GNAT superfamily N-acetyltransferase